MNSFRLAVFAVPVLVAAALAQAPDTFRPEAHSGWSVLAGQERFRGAARMVPAYLERLAAAQDRQRRDAIATLRTRDDWQQYRAAALAKLREAVGPFPSARTPLNAKVTGKLVREGYTVEKLIFESRPRYYVTANAYVPSRAQPPFPAVLCPVGHWGTGKAYEDYQRLAIYLARRGFLVLVYDLPGQGERLLYYDSVIDRSLVDPATSEYYVTIEHGVAMGPAIVTTGNNLAPYEMWDGLRALDYLSERKDVDPRRIACTGTSGGGLQTEMLAALDDRIRVAIPVSYGGCAADQPERPGLSMADVDALIAPRPLLMMNATGDSAQAVLGKKQRYELVAGVYKLLDASNRTAFLVGDGRHGYLHDLRAAAYQWLSRWMLDREAAPESLAEPATEIESQADLAATATGQVRTALGGETILTLLREQASAEASSRVAWPTGRDHLAEWRDRIRKEAVAGLRFARQSGPVDAQVIGRIDKGAYTLEKLVYYSEPEVFVPALLLVPKQTGPRPAIVVVNEGGKSAGRAPEELLEPLARAGYAVLAIDPRGTGETTPPTPSEYNHRNYRGFTEDSEADLFYDSLRAGRTILGQRVVDVLRGVDYLQGRAEVNRAKIMLAGQGSGALTALFAAALDERVAAAACTRMLDSYAAIPAVDLYAHRPGDFVPGALGAFDLPEVAGMVAPRPLLLLNMVDAHGRRAVIERQRGLYRPAMGVYGLAGADNALRLAQADSPAEIVQQYLHHFGGL